MGIDEKSCICIWNPSTGKYKNIKIPPYDFHSRLSNLVRYGFGYDSHKDDYKLVRISDNEDPGCFNIQVHMLASKSWKTIQRTDCYAFPRLSGVLVNGALHWLGVTTQGAPSEVIVSFNINYDRLMDISFPGETMPSLEGNRVLYKDVGVLGDCLCIVFAVLGIRTDVWVMQDYGIRESWIKRFTTTTSSENIERSPLMVRYWECSISKRMWSLESGEILVDEHQDLILYDQSYKTSRYLTSYVESLVSIKSRMHVKKRNTNGDNKKKPKQQRLR